MLLIRCSCSQPKESRHLSSARERELDVLVERFGAKHDTKKNQITLDMNGAHPTKTAVRKKVKHWCKWVSSGYITRDGVIVLKLKECHSRSAEDILRSVLYEVARAVDGQAPASVSPKKPKYRHKRRSQKKGKAIIAQHARS